jgi:hypothetical protein
MNYFIFLVIFEELLDSTMWLKLPTGWSAGYQKKFVLSIKSWIFCFFSKIKLHMVLHDVIFNMATWIWSWSLWFFSRKFESSVLNTELAIHALGQVHCTYYYSIFHGPPRAWPCIRMQGQGPKIYRKNLIFLFIYYLLYFFMGHLWQS